MSGFPNPTPDPAPNPTSAQRRSFRERRASAAPTESTAPPTSPASAPAQEHQRQAPAASTRARGKRVTKRELANLTSQLAIMVRSDIDVAAALESLARQCSTPALKNALSEIHADVLSGASVSGAMGRHGHVFGETYIATVAAGEAAGRLPDVLAQLAELTRSDLRLQNTIRSALIYPVLLTLVSSFVLAALVLFVLPEFAEIFRQYDVPLPAITEVLLAVSGELQMRFWLWGPAFALLIGGAAAFRWSQTGQRWWDHAVLHARFVRDVTRSLFIGRTCRLLALTLQSGVPLVESLRLARKATANSLYRRLFAVVEDDVVNGRGMSNAFLACKFIPSSAAEMILTAEQTGNLGSVAELVGEYYEEEAQARLRELTTVLEPAITVGMGILVAFVVLAVMLPMFDIAMLARSG